MPGVFDLGVRTSRLFNALPRSAFIFRLDRSGVFLEVIGYPDQKRLWMSPDSHIGKTLEQVLPPELACDRRYYFEKVLRTKRQQTYAYPHPLTRGRFMACTLIPVLDDQEVYEVIMQVQDVEPITPVSELYVLPN